MRGTARLGFIAVLGVACFLTFCPASSATVFTVDSRDYSNSDALDPYAIVDRYELTAKSSDSVIYSVVAAPEVGGCVQIYFSKGHNLGTYFEYLVSYSMDSCVGSYANTYPVGSSDGTDFTITITTTFEFIMNYTLNIKMISVTVPEWLCPTLAATVLVVAAIALVLMVRQRRRRAAVQPFLPSQQTDYQNPPTPPQQ